MSHIIKSSSIRGYSRVDLPPIGAAKQQPTPTAQAADSISVFLNSFCPTRVRYTHIPIHAEQCIQANTHTFKSQEVHVYLQMPQTYIQNQFILQTQQFDCKAAVCTHSTRLLIYDWSLMGGYNWKTMIEGWNHEMRCLCRSKSNTDRCLSATVHWTESNTVQTNGKTSICLSSQMDSLN